MRRNIRGQVVLQSVRVDHGAAGRKPQVGDAHTVFSTCVEARGRRENTEINPWPRRRSAGTRKTTTESDAPPTPLPEICARFPPCVKARGRGDEFGGNRELSRWRFEGEKKKIRSEQKEKSPPRPAHCSRTGRKRRSVLKGWISAGSPENRVWSAGSLDRGCCLCALRQTLKYGVGFQS
ncbi:unnamed protein product [Pleuronectes platessa]|uniref:Uncharacterized protein n=1 Tax=Pleuronectes platessa TaxID=8262 RepID=A0A9N7YVC2_PLEPL|nr:unnamed protein product [Pleuronectes platessa]